MATGQETGDRTTVNGCGGMKYYFRCPSCGSDDEFSVPREESSGLGLLLFFLGDFIPLLLYADTTRRRVQCAKCGYIFRQPAMRRTAVSTLAAWVIGIALLFGFFAVLLIAFPEILDLVPESPTLAAIEQVISDNPRVVALIVLGFVLMNVAILVLSLLVSWVSNYRAHAELRKKFETKPKQYAETKQETARMG